MILQTFICSIVLVSAIACTNNLQITEPAANKTTAAVPAIDGEKLYKSKCAQCHTCNKDISGPALNGTMKNWPDKKIFYAFVRNSQEVIKTNAYAKALYKKWMNTNMPAYPNLSDKDIDAIMNWCSNQP
jgi:mono/diheme cytochrome c family protein